jgi:hypothetical protein
MKYSVSTFILTLLFTFVSADRMIRILFNNGNVLPSNESCNTADNVKLDQIINSAAAGRNLRTGAENAHRQLWPAYCERQCAGFVKNHCLATGCKGYRRGLGKFVAEDRDLQLNMSCDEQIQDISTKLNNLVSNKEVSFNCRALLNAPRNVTCQDDAIYGED